MKEEEKIATFQKQRKQLEQQISNIDAQEASSAKEIESINDNEVKDLMEEAVWVTDQTQDLKAVEAFVSRTSREPMEQRYFGENGDGTATSLRHIHGAVSNSDVERLKGDERRACLTFAATFGAETLASWVGKWKDRPDGMTQADWENLVGPKPGIIPCHNSVTKERAAAIMFHLYDLSPVDSPVQSRKRHRSPSRGRSASRGRSPSLGRSLSRGRNKKQRLSLDDFDVTSLSASISAGIAMAMANHVAQEESSSDLEGEE